jgi:hypothetical protein
MSNQFLQINMQTKPTYKLNHEVLPYEIERGLPYAVIDSIYSFLRPRFSQTPKKIKIERMKIEFNHKLSTYKELLLEKKRRLLLRQKQEEERKNLVGKIDGLIKVLEKSL